MSQFGLMGQVTIGADLFRIVNLLSASGPFRYNLTTQVLQFPNNGLGLFFFFGQALTFMDMRLLC